VTGLYGARALARAILNGRDYKRELRELKLELNLHLLIRNILNRFRNEDYDELLDRFNGTLMGLLQRWNRDELRSFFFKMILTEPHLLRIGLKTLFRSLQEGKVGG
jgi:hypothetical protein